MHEVASSSLASPTNFQILVVERKSAQSHFQLPQGGIDKGETEEQAIMREMKEEIGTSAFTIIKHAPLFYKYKWPRIDQLRRGYRGQIQDLFILEFTGKDEDIIIDGREHKSFKWVPLEHAIKEVHPVRREQVKRAVAAFNSV